MPKPLYDGLTDMMVWSIIPILWFEEIWFDKEFFALHYDPPF
jgi:hypothetical protein